MSKQYSNCLPHKTLRVAGISILIMAVLAAVSMGLFFEEALKLKGEPLQQYYQQNISSYRIATVSWVLILLCDLIATVCFFEVFRHKHPFTGRITSLLRLVYSAFLLFGIMKLFRIWNMPADTADSVSTIMQSVYGFQSLWYAGLVIFGLHLIGLAMLTPSATKVQLAIRWSLVLGGIGYILLDGGQLLIADFSQIKQTIEPILIVPMILGELGLALYMTVAPKKLSGTPAYPVPNPA